MAAHSVCYHQYADNTQLYMAFQPNNGSAALSAVSDCAADVSRWFLKNGLLLNPSKMEAVVFGTRAQTDKIDTADEINVAGTIVKLSSKVKLLGVTLDTTLSMDQHVTDVVHSCSYHIRALRHIRPCLTMDATKMIAQESRSMSVYRIVLYVVFK